MSDWSSDVCSSDLDDATPMSVSMPLAAREHPHRVVDPFLWGLLPDNDAVISRWGRNFQVSTSHPFGLLANVGEDLQGAMQLVRPERVAKLEKAKGSSPEERRAGKECVGTGR